MKILVPIKRVNDYNVKVRPNQANTDVDLNNVKMAMNPFCEIAVEEAIRLKEAGKADEHVSVRPIAGTRPRGKTQEEDVAFEKDLLSDPKEISEHLMLIDLGRNDVGRVAEIGSVELTDHMVVERYSHVMHIVSHVEGRVRPDVSALDVLKACLPAGTLSGAPKVRAMELINQFEPVRRGIYGGAVGYLGWSGNMDTAIAIRTAVIKGGVMHIQAGAGLVADSVPQSEWMETLNKGRAVIRAANAALTGFQDLKGPMVRS